MSFVEGDWKLILPSNGPKLNRNTNTELGNDPEPQLYNLAADPGERNNVAADHPDRVKEMTSQLNKIKDTGLSRPWRGENEIMPQIHGVLETCLYVADLETTRRFYADLFHFPILSEDNRFCAFDVAGRNVLILFQQGASLTPIPLPGGTIPAHDGSGPIHLAFSISKQEYGEWQARLSANGITVESEVQWPLGGRSLYFRDPDGHVVELATPGVWATY